MVTFLMFTPHELEFVKLCNVPSNLSDNLEPLYSVDSYPLQLKHNISMNPDRQFNIT